MTRSDGGVDDYSACFLTKLQDLDSHLISFLRRSAGNGFHFDTEQETESAIVINGKICGFIKTLCRLIKISALQESNPLFPFDHCILCLLIRILQRTGRRIQRTGGRIQCWWSYWINLGSRLLVLGWFGRRTTHERNGRKANDKHNVK
ncbi:uncharacterized protein LOC122279188 isoform X3 [Carya illinoinensis]|uniref:Uncharacterized protein n=1 Tax=Carya illinoinensis TaxID=32201 RepID=A0A8T1P7C5_CARIL|nr:uncharacterized protein LOC122279188 isoform X3 [Carya illinoinensis]KAG6639859.1 hypothetical protein CIPAW_10G131400 [Carya illinoinensis]